jgi:hypothetical protein
MEGCRRLHVNRSVPGTEIGFALLSRHLGMGASGGFILCVAYGREHIETS